MIACLPCSTTKGLFLHNIDKHLSIQMVNFMLSDSGIPVPQMYIDCITVFIESCQLHLFESLYISSIAAHTSTALWKCFCIVIQYLENWIYDNLKIYAKNIELIQWMFINLVSDLIGSVGIKIEIQSNQNTLTVIGRISQPRAL